MTMRPRAFRSRHTRTTATALVATIAVSGMAMGGCAFRRSVHRSTLSSQVTIDQDGRDVATLDRSEYTVLGTAAGRDKTTRVFVLWFPVGNHKSPAEVWDSAYYDAVEHVEGCDGLLLPRAKTKRIVIPLLLVNIIVKKTALKGRCIQIKDDDELARSGHGPGHHGMHGHGPGHHRMHGAGPERGHRGHGGGKARPGPKPARDHAAPADRGHPEPTGDEGGRPGASRP